MNIPKRFSASCISLLCWAAVALAQVEPQDINDPKQLHDWLAATKARLLTQRFKMMQQTHLQETQYGYDVTFYNLDFKVDPNERILIGKVEIRGIITVPGDDPSEQRKSIPVDLYDNLTVSAVGGDAVGFTRDNNRLFLQIVPRAVGESFSVTIEYHGRPLETGFLAFAFREHLGTPIIATLSEPYFARVWWPCKDVPSDKADSARIKITVPSSLYAVSNGRLVRSEESNGWTTYEWFESYPITAYLISLAITNYEIYRDVYVNQAGDSLDVIYYIYPEDYESGVSDLSVTPAMLRIFERLFGPYPFAGEKYGQAQFPWPGGMEHQTATSLCCFGRSLVAHELAHQWWGDMITCANWQHIWLNEGFATYAEALYVEATSGPVLYREYMNRMAGNFNGRLFVDDTLNPGKIFARIQYHKGAWVLHMLRGLLGDETFFRVLREYGDDPRLKYATATTEDFQRVAERVSGRDLSVFFHQWVYSSGAPRYLYAWEAKKVGSDFQVILRIKQAQKDTTTFSMPIHVRIEYNGRSDSLLIENNSRCQTYVFTLPQSPRRILLDPDDWILKTAAEVPFETLTESCEIVPLTFRLKPVSPNPFRLYAEHSLLTFRFTLDSAGLTDLRIYNTLGQEVATLLDRRFLDPGSYYAPWQLQNQTGAFISTGVYFAVLKHRGRISRQKFLLVR